MPRDALGNYTLPAGNPVVSGTSISSTVHNNTIADLAAEMQDSLSRSGKGGMSGPFQFADGTAAAPSGNFASENETGFYRSAAQEWALSVYGVRIWKAMIISGSRVMSFVTGLFRSEVADGANTAFTFDTDAAKSNASFKLAKFVNGGVDKFVVDLDGCLPNLKIKQGSYTATVSASGSMAASIGMTLPSALPASTLPLTMTSAGLVEPTSPEAAAVTAVHANVSAGTQPGVERFSGIKRAWFTTTYDTAITGAITGCGAGGSPAGAGVLFNIPSGYRPTASATKNAIIPILWYDLGTTTLIPAALVTDNSGNIYFWGAGASLANGDILYFNNGASWVPE